MISDTAVSTRRSPPSFDTSSITTTTTRTKMNGYQSSSQGYAIPGQPLVHDYYGIQQVSPANSTSPTSSSNISPTSPRNPAHISNMTSGPKQLRSPKCPMYVPAALRPTERPSRPSPLTPPRSLHGSTDSLDGRAFSKPPSRQSNSDFKKGSTAASIASTDRSEPISGEQPTREHWKADASADVCDAPTCHKGFNFFERRHHCRVCGLIFCGVDSRWLVPLDEKAQFKLGGFEGRACSFCFQKYCQWMDEGVSFDRDTDADTLVPSTPGINVGKGLGTVADDQQPSLAHSVPSQWNWSSF
ncbi:hypothetical protein MMC25_003990 [Agyrium rufum]|nr:hypothetical protein [Agyrium rufum]